MISHSALHRYIDYSKARHLSVELKLASVDMLLYRQTWPGACFSSLLGSCMDTRSKMQSAEWKMVRPRGPRCKVTNEECEWRIPNRIAHCQGVLA